MEHLEHTFVFLPVGGPGGLGGRMAFREVGGDHQEKTEAESQSR
jgi:hypothetical protein